MQSEPMSNLQMIEQSIQDLTQTTADLATAAQPAVSTKPELGRHFYR